MRTGRATILATSIGMALAAQASLPAWSAPPADWSQIPTKSVVLFYPGQAGLQWVRSPDHKRANKQTLAGEACVSCHEGEEVDIGKLTVSGERLEPAPIDGKNGSVELKVQVAYDGENAYFRFQWPTLMNRAGESSMPSEGLMNERSACCPMARMTESASKRSVELSS